MPRDGQFWRGVFSEPEGSPSFSRVACGFVLLAATTWISAVLWRSKRLPDLASLAVYMGVVLGALYGTNKVATVVGKFVKNGQTEMEGKGS